MTVYAILATCGRHECLERSVACFIEQDYEDKCLMIYQNSDIPQTLSAELSKRHDIILLNRPLNMYGKKYTSLGDIYDSAMFFLSTYKSIEDDDVIVFWDDDDIFLPDHISSGVKGLLKCGKKAYKPAHSYYRHQGGIQLMNNTLEPSIFVNANHVIETGFSDTTTEQHLQWVHPLMEKGEIFADPEGKPTLIYNWGDTHIATYKTSGDYQNPDNFENCRTYSRSHGDQIITPITREALQAYYNMIDK